MAAETPAAPPPYLPADYDVIERTVVVAGQSGAGKSTFLKEVFGVEGVVTASGGPAGTMKPAFWKRSIAVNSTTRLELTLVDTPGFTDGTNTVGSVVRDTKQLLQTHGIPGIHIVFVFLDGKARRAQDFYDRLKEGLKQFMAHRTNYDDTHGIVVMSKATNMDKAETLYSEFKTSGGSAAEFIDSMVHGSLDFFNLLPEIDDDDDPNDIEKAQIKRARKVAECKERMLGHIICARDLKFTSFLSPSFFTRITGACAIL
eukprot:m.484669 g.484669  ORF g.484669 m.484669 type:complete len:258 (-) comp23492_c0_seq1:120-893(-)